MSYRLIRERSFASTKPEHGIIYNRDGWDDGCAFADCKLSRYFEEEGDLVWEAGLSESKIADKNKELYGRSAYWVCDLAGGVWERVVTIGNQKGRGIRLINCYLPSLTLGGLVFS